MSMDTPYASSPQAASTAATVSLVLGIVGILGTLGGCCCCVSHLLSLCAPIAAILGYQERQAIQQGRSSPAGAGMAQAGMILGMVGTGLLVLYFITVIIWIMVAGFSSVMHAITRGHWG
jgi:hypothetical protein